MKVILIFAMLLSICRLEAATDPKVTRFLELPPAQAAAYLTQVYGIRGDLITAAIGARRLDLVEICFRNEPLLTMEALGETQDLEFQDKAVIMILKADIPQWWMPEDPFADYSGPGRSGYMYKPIVKVLRRYLPDVPLDGKAVINSASRLNLAADLENKIAATKSQTEDITPPTKEAETTPPEAVPVRTETARDHAGATAPKKSPWAVGLVGTALVILLGIAGLRWIRRRRAS